MEYNKEYYEANREKILKKSAEKRKHRTEEQMEVLRANARRYYHKKKNAHNNDQGTPSSIIITKPTPSIKKDKKPLERNKPYLDKHDLYFECYVSKARGIISKKLFEYFLLIAKNVATKMHLQNLHYDQTMEAFCTLCENYQRIDMEKYQNIFSYLSEIAKRAMVQQYREIVFGLKKGSKEEGQKYLSLDHNFSENGSAKI